MEIFELTCRVMLGSRDRQLSNKCPINPMETADPLYLQLTVRDGCTSLSFYMLFILSLGEVGA